jgi:hypothetical protein
LHASLGRRTADRRNVFRSPLRNERVWLCRLRAGLLGSRCGRGRRVLDHLVARILGERSRRPGTGWGSDFLRGIHHLVLLEPSQNQPRRDDRVPGNKPRALSGTDRTGHAHHNCQRKTEHCNFHFRHSIDEPKERIRLPQKCPSKTGTGSRPFSNCAGNSGRERVPVPVLSELVNPSNSLSS